MDYQIVSDSSCDLEIAERQQYGIEVLPFYITFDEKNYKKEVDEIAIRDVYQRMVDEPKMYPKTSLPSVQDYVNVFMAHISEGRGVICICFTPSLSGSYNSACNAKDIVCEDYPNANITVINSQSGTVTQGLFVKQAARLKAEGKSYDEVVAALTNPDFLHSSHIFFTVGNTDYLKHGGRIGRVASVASSALNLKPLIVLEDGSIYAEGVVRSRKKSVIKSIEVARKYFESTGENPNDYEFSVGFGYDRKEGEEFLEQVKREFSDVEDIDKTPLVQIGATICVHTGPYAIGIGIIKKIV